jgi:hypothetical protein
LARGDFVLGDEGGEERVGTESRDGRVGHAEETVVGVVLEVGSEGVGSAEGLGGCGQTGD